MIPYTGDSVIVVFWSEFKAIVLASERKTQTHVNTHVASFGALVVHFIHEGGMWLYHYFILFATMPLMTVVKSTPIASLSYKTIGGPQKTFLGFQVRSPYYPKIRKSRALREPDQRPPD